MRIATWNVNSLKVRLPRVEAWLAQVEPDIVCLQETKVANDAFPAMTFAALGYEAIHHGTGRWNGVAILSRVGIEQIVDGFGPEPGPELGPDVAPEVDMDDESRLLTATCGGVRVVTVYVPNGRAVGHEQYHHKLAWLGQLRAHLERNADPAGDVVVCGDFNVAPDDRDVWDPALCHGGTHVSEPERAALGDLRQWGLVDVFRSRYTEGGLYSWWDYRAGAFHKHEGMRIDLLLASSSLASRLSWVLIDRNARKGSQPSDHAPLVAEFA